MSFTVAVPIKILKTKMFLKRRKIFRLLYIINVIQYNNGKKVILKHTT